MMPASALQSAQDAPLLLLPYPRSIKRLAGVCRLTAGGPLAAGQGSESDALGREAFAVLRRALEGLPASTSDGEAPAPVELRACAAGELADAREGYRLVVEPGGVRLEAASPRGRFYAAQTFAQLVRQFGPLLPCLRIEDAPDLPIRGAMFDVSRGKVPTLETLLGLVEWLAAFKYNQLQLYIEHTFAFERHPLLGEGHSPLSPDDIRALDAHCRRFHVELVPNLQSFGHVAHTLEHARYAPLAESDFRGGWTLSPVVPETYTLLAELYEEFLPCFTHRPFFNVNCDETYDLGQGRSAALARELGGKEWVYQRHLKRVHALAAQHGLRACFWADIAEESAAIFRDLPRDMVALHWWYESEGKSAEDDYMGRVRPSMQAGLEHWVCPGTSGWLSFFFRKPNARGNLRRWAQAARASGALGYLVTDWGDFGHHNCLSYSYWPLAYGAECSWSAEAAPGVEQRFDAAFWQHGLPGAPGHWAALHDAAGSLYKTLMRDATGVPNTLARLMLTHDYRQDASGALKLHFIDAVEYPLPPAENIAATLAQAEAIEAALAADQGRFGGALELVRREWQVGMQLQACACRRALGMLGDARAGSFSDWQEFVRTTTLGLADVWHRRNRPSDWDLNQTRLMEVAATPWR